MIKFNDIFKSNLPKRSDFTRGIAINKNLKTVNLFLNDLTIKSIYKQTIICASATAAGGQKVLVIMKNIPIFIDVRVYGDYTNFKTSLLEKIEYNVEIKEVRQYPGKEFVLEPQKYCRVYFINKSQRKKTIEMLYGSIIIVNGKSYKIELANDDLDLMMLIIRHCGFNSCGWNKFIDYQSETIYGDKSVEQISVDINKIEPIDCDLIDKTLLCGWDLETTSDMPDGHAPKAYRRDSYITMNALVFRWRGDKKTLCKFIITDMLAPPVEGVITILCRDETEIIKATSIVLKNMYPDYIIGFNDGGYDWQFINWRINPNFMMRRDKKFNNTTYLNKITETSSTKLLYNTFINNICAFNCKNNKYNVLCKSAHKSKIKIPNAAPPVYNYVKCAGMIGFDVMIELCKKHPKTPKKNLNYWLSRYKLESKTDMKYDLMDRIFSISKLAQYCGITSYSELINKIKSGEFKICRDEKCDKKNCMCRYSNNRVKAILNKRGLYDIRLKPCDLLNHVKQMDKVSIYNTRDSIAVLDLVDSANIINDVREKCNLSYTMILDGFYRADAIKVTNMVARVASQPKWGRDNNSRLAFPMYLPYTNEVISDKDRLKYEGAYVLQPKKGCYCKTLLEKRSYRRTGLIENCYPDDADNFDKTLLLSDKQIADILLSRGYDVDKNGIFDFMDVDCKTRFTELLISPQKHPLIYNAAANDVISAPQKWIKYFAAEKKPCIDILDRFDRPKSGLDFKSLYPSIIMTYNLSTDMFVKDPAFAEKLIKAGYKLLRADVVYKRVDDPVTPQNTYTGWFVQHEGIENNYRGMGIFACILRNLFNRRKKLKREMNYWKSGLERMKRDIDPVINEVNYNSVIAILEKKRDMFLAKADKLTGIRKKLIMNKANMYKDGIEFINKEIKEITAENNDFAKSYKLLKEKAALKSMIYNTKQLALKVFMNTFYGAAGFSKGTLFIVELSGCVTIKGKESIKHAKQYVEELDFEVFYGDTDSIYISPPEKCFEDVDAAYLRGDLSKEKFYEEMVAITMTQMGIISGKINNEFRTRTGTEFLKMAYEEVTFPVILTGKKKYAAIEHINSIDFSLTRPNADFNKFCEDLFVRGLDFVKRGGSKLMKENCQRILFEAFRITDHRVLKDVVIDNIKRIINTKWDVKYLQKSYCYRITKSGNVNHIVRFVQRMQEYEDNGICNIRAPILGERFNVIKCREYVEYDLGGAKIIQKTGDLLEYPHLIGNKEYESIVGHPIEPDLLYYLTDVLAKFARYLSYHPEWNKYYKPNMTAEEYKESDAKAAEEIKKYLVKKYCGGFTADVAKSQLYKRKYREFVKKYKEFGDKTLMRAIVKNNHLIDSLREEIDKAAVPNAKWHEPLFESIEKKLGVWKFRAYINRFVKQNRVINSLIELSLKKIITLLEKNKWNIKKERMRIRNMYESDKEITFSDEFRGIIAEINRLKNRTAAYKRLVNQYNIWAEKIKIKAKNEIREHINIDSQSCNMLEEKKIIEIKENPQTEYDMYSSYADEYNKYYAI